MIPSSFRPRRRAGVGLVTAIFLLVVLAGLGTAMVGIYTGQQAGADLDLQGARAYQAARAGLEWGVFRQRRLGQCEAARAVPMPADGSLAGFTVIVNCAPLAAPPAPTAPLAAGTDNAQLQRWEIRATACNVPDAQNSCTIPSNARDYVRRIVEAEL